MLELDTGRVTIDGIDISTIPRQEVRQRVNTLPQEPFFLRGSVRDNLDPLCETDDGRITRALGTVQLWDLLEPRGGLDGDLDEAVLSHGEKQLFCLARAIIKPSNILIMDEATSRYLPHYRRQLLAWKDDTILNFRSIDSESEELVRQLIRTEFSGHTVIAIAHKLANVLDFDRVVLLDKGTIAECGNPRELLATPSSSFAALYRSMEFSGGVREA